MKFKEWITKCLKLIFGLTTRQCVRHHRRAPKRPVARRRRSPPRRGAGAAPPRCQPPGYVKEVVFRFRALGFYAKEVSFLALSLDGRATMPAESGSYGCAAMHVLR